MDILDPLDDRYERDQISALHAVRTELCNWPAADKVTFCVRAPRPAIPVITMSNFGLNKQDELRRRNGGRRRCESHTQRGLEHHRGAGDGQ